LSNSTIPLCISTACSIVVGRCCKNDLKGSCAVSVLRGDDGLMVLRSFSRLWAWKCTLRFQIECNRNLQRKHPTEHLQHQVSGSITYFCWV
jgi:hypothetical protein